MNNTIKLSSLLLALGMTSCHTKNADYQGIEQIVNLQETNAVVGVDGASFEERVVDSFVGTYQEKELLVLVKEGNPIMADKHGALQPPYQYLDVAGYVLAKKPYRVLPIVADTDKSEITTLLERSYPSFTISFSN